MKSEAGIDRRMIAAVCDRHFGVGADGLMAAMPSEFADVRMAYYNSDGSEASMCGNGIRCFSKFVRDHGIVGTADFTVETGDGIKRVSIVSETPEMTTVKVSMGVLGDISKVETSEWGELIFTHLGVPHAVLFKDTDGGGMAALDALALSQGSRIENAPQFQPDRANVNFVEILNEDHILCSTWERGAGKTLACGTGACASAAASYLFCGCHDSIHVTMPGGEVVVSFDSDRNIFMEGPAVLICTGHY